MQIKHIKQNLIFFKGKSLTFRLALWFIFISLIPLIILGFSFFSVAQDSLLRHIYSELNTISNLKKHQIETYAIERKNDIEVLAHSLLLQQAINSFSQVFNKDGVNSPKYHAIEQKFKPFFERHLNNFEKYDAVLISPSGDVIYSMLSNKELGTNLISGQFKDSILSEVYKKSIENPNMIVQSEIGFFQPTNRIEMLITATVMDKSTPIGVLAIVLDVNEFLLKSSDFNSLGKTGEVILVEKIDNRAIIVSPLRFDPYDTYKRNIIIGSQDAIPLQKAVSGEHGYGQFIDYRGKDVLAVWNHLKLNGKGIIVKIDKDEAYAPIYHLKHLFIAISIFLISTLVIVIFLLSKSISKPIISLTNTTRVIAQGNYTHEVKMNSHDEIGILADSINVMAQNLKIKEEQHIRFEAELSAQKDALDDAQRIAHIGNWSWNINDNTVLWSKEMYNIYGVDIRTFKPDYDSIKRFIHPEDIHKSDEILYDNKKFRSDDYRIILEDGTIRYISAFVEVKFNEDFKGIYLVGTSQDITARKQLEIELYNHMHLLAQQSKMASMGEMLGAIAHQWRQPLNAINLIIQDLADAFKFGELDDIYITRSVRDISNQIYFMSNTIEDFRNFFKPDKEKILFNVSSTIVEVINLLYEQIIKSSILISLNGITAENIKADGIVSDILVTGYPNEFKQVVLNILTNARDAIIERRNRGLIKDNEKGLIEIEILNNNDMTIIKFKDNGGGIPEELISRVFDQYFTSKKDGTGIGLYMSKQIIEKNMEGRLSVENIDNGAMFLMELKSHEIV